MAGVPFEAIDGLATSAASCAARELIVRQDECEQVRAELEQLLQGRTHGLPEKTFRAWRRTLRNGAPPPAEPTSGPFARYQDCAARIAAAEQQLEQALAEELPAAREQLYAQSRQYLPAYLVFASPGARDRVIAQLAQTAAVLPPRNKQARADERHLLLYLQRIAAKNDSLSAFGPEGWGKLGGAPGAMSIDPVPGIARRETFLERWTAHGAAAAINADPTVRPELAPRLEPTGKIEENAFVFTATGDRISLDPATVALLRACDGRTPAYSLGDSLGSSSGHLLERLTALAEQKLIRWEMEVPALDPYAFQTLVNDIEQWREGKARDRWLARLQPIAQLPKKFAAIIDTQERIAIVDEAAARLDDLGAHRSSTRFLYSAINPIGEECFRESRLTIAEDLFNQVPEQAAPWIDLWRDNYAFAASRVAAGLRRLVESAPRQNGSLPLPAFLKHCAEAKLPLTGPGLVAFAAGAFHEVKAEFARISAPHADAAEYVVRPEECRFIRENFDYPHFDEYTYPSADIQLSAVSVEAVNRGNYQWILAELHPPPALLHHGFYWSCPDKPALNAAINSILFGRPSFQFGYFAADFTATTAVHLFDSLGELTYFVSPQRGNPEWKSLPPSEAEVFIDEKDGDVALRRRGNGEYLGSFARGWIIPLGFHPFSFSLGKHTPRLLCGDVVVQRRAWTVSLEELGAGDFTGVSRALVVAVEKLRAQRDLPRHVYIRPTEGALRRSGAEGRDKDTKPVYIDFESYLCLEIFYRWLTKAGELEVSEMLPDPDHLLWQETDGRRTFELRTQIVPR